MEFVLPAITVITAFNLLIIALYGWIFRRKEKPFLWLGLMFVSLTFVITSNLLIHYKISHSLMWHTAIFLNLSWGAYFVMLTYSLRNTGIKTCFIYLFSPSFVYGIYAVWTYFIPGYNAAQMAALYNGTPGLAMLIANYVIILYSVGANLTMILQELSGKHKDASPFFRKRRIRILLTFFVMQTVTFIPYIITQSQTYLIFLMPVASFVAYLWVFFRLQHILNVSALMPADEIPRNLYYEPKYKNLNLDTAQKALLSEQIETYLREQKPFLETKYTLNDLSQAIGQSPHVVSMIINSMMGTTFSELVNRLRIEEALRILKAQPDIKIEALMYDCGFGNKSSFYKAFRKVTGMLPKDYVAKESVKL